MTEGIGIKLHINGATISGGPFPGMIVANYADYGSCGNVTCTAIMQILKSVAIKLKESSSYFWPNKLHLQLDNSGKDNKNNTVITFLAMLVARDNFEEIFMSFMLVGHTHDLVDQMFSAFRQ